SSALPVKVVRGNRSAASSGGGRWVTTTTGAPAGWLSPQPSVWSNSRRPATIAPQPDVSSRSIGALAASTEKLMLSCALGTTTSPIQYQSNNSAGLSSGWATKPSSDMHMWVSTLAMVMSSPWEGSISVSADGSHLRNSSQSGCIGATAWRPAEAIFGRAAVPGSYASARAADRTTALSNSMSVSV